MPPVVTPRLSSFARLSRRRWRPGAWLLALGALLLAASAVALAADLGPLGFADRAAPICRGERATIVGTSGADRLVGTHRADVIWAGAGDDVVLGRGGDDLICARLGNDRIAGGAGDDGIGGGGGGGDRLKGGTGDDVISGWAGDDVIRGGRGNDRLLGRGGNDTLYGNAGDDDLDGGPGIDRCFGGPGTNVLQDCEDETDQPPVAAGDSAKVVEDSGATAIDVLANDTDADGGPKSIASVSDPANGAVVITGGGSGLTYAPDPNYCNDPPGTSPDTFSYTLNGGSSATVSVTVTCVDDAPIAVDDDATVGEDSGASAVDVLANDSNPDGGPMTVASAADPANGTVVVTGGGTGLTYQPDPNYCNDPPGTTPDTFTYTLNGGSTATVSVTVTCAGAPPSAVDDSATVGEDSGASAIDVLANDTDTDGGPKSIASVSDPANGVVVITGGGSGLTYEPDPNYCNDPPGTSPDTFTYTLNGGSTATVSVTVNCVDDAPIAVDDAATVGEDSGASAVDVLANDTDTDGGPKSIVSVSDPANGAVVITGGGSGLTYEPDPNYCNDPPGTSPDTFTYTLNGGSSATVSVTVTCVDDAPIAVDDAATVGEDSGASAVDVLANDSNPDGGAITVASASDPTNGTVVVTGGGTGLTYQPDPNYCNDPPGTTPDTFTYTLNGGSTATVSVKVTCADDAPTAVDDSATVSQDAGATAIAVLANDTDVDGGPMTIASASDPANGTVALTGGSLGAHTGLTYQPDPGYCNSDPGGVPDRFAYTLNGGSTATVSVTVSCPGAPPAAVDDSATVGEDSGATAIDVLANDTDTDGGPMTIVSASDPANGAVVITGGGSGLTYEPDPNYCNDPPGTSPDTFTYTLNGGSSATVSVTVTCVDDAPIAVDDAATVGEDSGASAVDVLANDSNPDGGAITVASASDPTNGTVVVTGGGTGLTYQPDPNYCNDPPGTTPDTFTYTLNGGSTATVAVTVTCADDAPTAVDDSATVSENAPASAIGVLANDTDIDGGPMTIASASDPASGTVVLTGGLPGANTGMTYQPDAGYCNDPPGTTPDTFTYTLNGGSSATVSVTVTCLDDPPTAVDDNATVGEDSGASAINVLANDTDPDGGPKTIASASDPANGTVVLTGGSPGAHTGLTYQPDPNYCNDPPSTTPDTFTYTLNGGSSATVSVKVTCVDDAPIAVNDGATVAEDSGASAIDVLANDDNDDGGPMTIASASDPANGTVVLTGGSPGAHTGLTYQPDPNYCNDPPGTTDDTFTYTLNGGSTATVAVTVDCAPDDPVVDTSPGSTSYTENAPATPIDSALTLSDPDAGTTIISATVKITANYGGAEDILALAGSHPGITSSVAGDTLTLTGNASLGAYQSALRDVTYSNSSDNPSTAARTVTFTVTDDTSRSGSDTKGVTVVAVDDPPTAVNDSATVLEDAAATAVTVLTNDTDVDAGPKSIGSVTQPANGTVVITGGGTGLTYQPSANYCNDPPGTTPDTFTYTLNGGSNATVSMMVTCVNDAPVADDETFSGNDSAHGNTTLQVDDPDDNKSAPTHPHTEITGDILAGDTDIDGPGPLTVTPGTFATNDGGSVTIESDGDFTFHPAAGTSCTDTSDFFDYTVEDSGSPELTDTGRVTIAIAGCVWYVSNNAAGNSGTSALPFDTLAQAETASGNNHTVFVFDGDNTSTGLDAGGYAMNAGERLIGEHEGLVVDPDGGGALTADTLHPANPGAHPTLTANGADVIDLDDGNEVRGFNIDPSGTGGGIAGSLGDTGGGTIDDVNVLDTLGTAGQQAGLELNATTGTFNVSDFTVNNNATGVLLNNAGTVVFDPASNVTIASAGARGLDASGTGLGTSTFDQITVTGSGVGGVRMSGTSGTTTFGGLSLTTTGGTGFLLSSAGAVTVAAAGTANVSATGGPAVDVTGTGGATLSFDDVSSTNSPGDGIDIAGLAGGSFSAASGTIAGAGGIAFDLEGGSGTINYPGAINNGQGSTAEITGRSGGTVTLSGAITETGDADATQENGGIAITGNTGGSTVVSNVTKVFNTGEDHAIVMGTSDGHTLTLSGGGLDVDTTTGKGLEATSSGTLNITGISNTIDTGAGKALNVTDTDVGATPLNFQRVSSNGANGGIVLNNTGANSALTVVGTGGTCTNADTTGCSGGVIQNTTGADSSAAVPAGAGIVLSNTRGISLTRMHIHDHQNYGIRGTSVNGFTLADSVLNGTNGTSDVTNVRDSGVRFVNLGGTVSVTNDDISGGYTSNFTIDNDSGALSSTFTGNDFGSVSTAGGDDSLHVIGTGTSEVDATVQTSTFNSARGDIFQYAGNGTGGGDLAFTGNTVTNTHPAIATGGGGITISGSAAGPETINVSNNTMRDALTHALTVVKSAGSGSFTGTINNNQIGDFAAPLDPNAGSLEGAGIEVTTFGGGGNMTLNITNNQIRQYNTFGMSLVAGGGVASSGQFNFNISGNTISNEGTNPSVTLFQGIGVNSGVAAGDTFQTCVNFGANSIAGSGSDSITDSDFRIRARQNTTVRLPGYAGGATNGAAAATFVEGKIGAGTQGTAAAFDSGTFTGTGTTCP